jgi:hypothetical protein
VEYPEDIMDFTDCTGKERRFRFQVMEVGPLIRMEAKEIRGDRQPGYYFRQIGMADHLALLRGKLNQAIMEGLSKRYILPRKEGVGKWQMLTDELAGYVGYDDANDEACMVVDGCKVTVNELIDLVRMYEGFFFHLKFED